MPSLTTETMMTNMKGAKEDAGEYGLI